MNKTFHSLEEALSGVSTMLAKVPFYWLGVDQASVVVAFAEGRQNVASQSANNPPELKVYI